MDPAERQEALLAAGVQPNPLVPLAANWAAPRGWKDGVFKQGAVVLAGDMLLEALDGDALARNELKARQEFRKQQRLKQMAMQKAMNTVDVQGAAGRGTPGQRMETKCGLILRREEELSSEKVGRVPQGAVLHILEVSKPTPEGLRRALVQDTWGKCKGWLTAVDVDGSSNLQPVREAQRQATGDETFRYDDDDRGSWLGGQQDMWREAHFPKHDSILGQQEKSAPKNMELKQMQRQRRQQKMTGSAGSKSVIQPGQGAPRASSAFRAARAMGAR